MKILNRYLLKELFYYFGLFLLLFSAILIAKEIYDTRDEILDEGPSAWVVVQYILLALPAQIVEAMPLLALFSALFSIGLLSKNREILAMVSIGVTFRRLAIPVAIFGTAVGLLTFFMSAELTPAAQSRARYLYEVEIKGENIYTFSGDDDVFTPGEANRVYIMANFDREEMVMSHPTILLKSSDRSGLQERIEAVEGHYAGEAESGADLWEFTQMQRWRFGEDGSVQWEEFDEPYQLELEHELASFLARKKRPDEMNLGELMQFISVLRRQEGQARLPVFRTAFLSKLTLPLVCVLLSLVGFAAAADLKTPNFMFAFSYGLGLGICFYLLREGLGGLGRGAVLPPMLAAWGPAIIFMAVVAGLLQRLRIVH